MPARIGYWDISLTAVQIAAAIIIALQLGLVVLWCSSRSNQTVTGLSSAELSLIDGASILILSYFEQKKATRPSILLNVCLLFSILFNATQVRTLCLIGYDNIAAVQTASSGIKISMLFLEAQTKVPYLIPPYDKCPTEATSGIFNLSFLWWLN